MEKWRRDHHFLSRTKSFSLHFLVQPSPMCKRTQQLPTLLAQQCWQLLHVAESLTGLKLCATIPNNTEQYVACEAPDAFKRRPEMRLALRRLNNMQQIHNIQQSCVRLQGLDNELLLGSNTSNTPFRRFLTNFWKDGFFTCANRLHRTVQILWQIAVLFSLQKLARFRGSRVNEMQIHASFCPFKNLSFAWNLKSVTSVIPYVQDFTAMNVFLSLLFWDGSFFDTNSFFALRW